MLKSNVQTSSGNTKHYIGSVQNGQIIRHKHISDPKYVTIVEGDNGYYLLRYNDADICISDSWFETLDQAKKQAEFEYAIRSSDWERIE